jgi:hypothetical protein
MEIEMITIKIDVQLDKHADIHIFLHNYHSVLMGLTLRCAKTDGAELRREGLS